MIKFVKFVCGHMFVVGGVVVVVMLLVVEGITNKLHN